MSSCHHPLSDFEFPPDEIAAAAKHNRLLSMEIEFSLRCNFRCPYCYVPAESYYENELTPEEIQGVILQAKALGARKIIILGGEPTIYPHLLEMIRFIRNEGLLVEMFTNGTGVNRAVAEQLRANEVRIVLKMNTFDEDLQDKLAGKPGAHRIIRKALDNLKQAGYPAEDAFLAVSTIICRQNLAELPQLWQWLKDQNIAPYFEIITPQENAKKNRWLDVAPQELEALFHQIAEIDRERYGRMWDPQPPLVGNKCMRHQFSCLVTSKGEVFPCVGITHSIGSIRERSLAEIIRNSEVLNQLKDHRRTIKGPCRDCEKAADCYGCRGAAYQITGDYLASDPLCWRNSK